MHESHADCLTILLKKLYQNLPDHSFKYVGQVTRQSNWSEVLGRTSASTLVDWADQNQKEVRRNETMVERWSPKYKEFLQVLSNEVGRPSAPVAEEGFSSWHAISISASENLMSDSATTLAWLDKHKFVMVRKEIGSEIRVRVRLTWGILAFGFCLVLA